MTKAPLPPHARPLDGPGPDAARLADLLRAHAPCDGSFELRVPGVHVTRSSRVHKELAHGVLRPSLCVVAQAVAWVQGHFDQPLDVERLATLAHMSPSSFHQHFKAITSMSPLQYQKALRLQEARRLMLMTMLDAGTAGRRVGYLSPSQFSREYGRYFGHAPTRDMARLRQQREPAPEASVE